MISKWMVFTDIEDTTFECLLAKIWCWLNNIVENENVHDFSKFIFNFIFISIFIHLENMNETICIKYYAIFVKFS